MARCLSPLGLAKFKADAEGATWRSGDRQPPLWLGFVPSTAAPPYTFVLLDEREQPICRSGLTVAEPVHIWLDQPEGGGGNMLGLG